jgi:hypothetical protein
MTSQRFGSYFFADPHFLKTFLASRTSGLFAFAATALSHGKAKAKKPLFPEI